MEFTINGNDVGPAVQGGHPEVIEQDSIPTHPLAALRARREQIVGELYTDIKVPRWDEPEIYVRFKPVSTTKLAASIEKRRKAKEDNWSILANADILIDACVGIYAVIPGSDQKLSLREGDPYGEWTKFDPALAEAIGIVGKRATDAVLGLYLTEGDLIDTANKLLKWSNIANDEADETF
jgi:hypothetical protein